MTDVLSDELDCIADDLEQLLVCYPEQFTEPMLTLYHSIRDRLDSLIKAGLP